MKKTILWISVIMIGLTGCKSDMNYGKIVPDHVDKFATNFFKEVRNGNIDTCYSLMDVDFQKARGKEVLRKSHNHIKNYSIDSFSINRARKRTIHYDEGFTNYWIEYEYVLSDKYLYVIFNILEKDDVLKVTNFEGNVSDISLAKIHEFTFKNKGILHYIFLVFALLVPAFIIVTLIFAIRTRLEKKWLWIIGILFGFIKFSINWTSGQIGYQLISISLLGSGIVKSGNSAPWILSFSIPIVALIFWNKKIRDKNTEKKQEEFDKE